MDATHAARALRARAKRAAPPKAGTFVTSRVTIKELRSVRWSVAREPAFGLALNRAFWLAVAVLVLFSGLGTVWYDRAADAQLLGDDFVGVGVVGVVDGANRCVRTLEQVSQALGFSCPKALGAAQVLAMNSATTWRATAGLLFDQFL